MNRSNAVLFASWSICLSLDSTIGMPSRPAGGGSSSASIAARKSGPSALRRARNSSLGIASIGSSGSTRIIVIRVSPRNTGQASRSFAHWIQCVVFGIL